MQKRQRLSASKTNMTLRSHVSSLKSHIKDWSTSGDLSTTPVMRASSLSANEATFEEVPELPSILSQECGSVKRGRGRPPRKTIVDNQESPANLSLLSLEKNKEKERKEKTDTRSWKEYYSAYANAVPKKLSKQKPKKVNRRKKRRRQKNIDEKELSTDLTISFEKDTMEEVQESIINWNDYYIANIMLKSNTEKPMTEEQWNDYYHQRNASLGKTDARHYIKNDVLQKSLSLKLAHHYAETEDIKWDAKRPQDTTNDNVSKLVQTSEENIAFDHIDKYPYLTQLRDITASWMREMFGKETPLYQSWIVKYNSSSNVGKSIIEGSLDFHVDGSCDSGDLCAVVYTGHHGDVDGGWVSYSPNDDGAYILHKENNTRFVPPHNSCYMLFGSYVQHAVGRVNRGTRISIIFFYKPEIRFHLLIFSWGQRPEQCPGCFGLYKHRKQLRRHVKNCSKTVMFNRFKEDGYNFNPNVEL